MLDINKLKSLGNIKTYRADEYIFYEGEKGCEMFLVLSGKVEILLNSIDGSQIKLAEIKPGNFFGEMSVLDDQPRSASAIAASDSILISIGKNNFEAFLSVVPDMALKIMNVLCSRIRSLNMEISRYKEGSQEPRLQAAEAKAGVKYENLENSVLPKGHKFYSIAQPQSYKDYLLDKEMKCPVCSKSFTTKMQRVSKLKLDRVDYDFRHRYIDFEPIWYNILRCPNCNYANFYYDFESLTDKAIKTLQGSMKDLSSKLPAGFVKFQDIDRVFTLFYMADYCMRLYKASDIKMAKLWMQLSWLYKDAGDEEMFSLASSKAFEYYYSVYYNSKTSLPVEQEQQLCLILGELYLLKGDVKEAQKHFFAAIRRSNGKPALNSQAQNRVEDMKSKTQT